MAKVYIIEYDTDFREYEVALSYGSAKAHLETEGYQEVQAPDTDHEDGLFFFPGNKHFAASEARIITRTLIETPEHLTLYGDLRIAGIEVWVEGDKVIIADNNIREEYPDSHEKRAELVQRAREIVLTWEWHDSLEEEEDN